MSTPAQAFVDYRNSVIYSLPHEKQAEGLLEGAGDYLMKNPWAMGGAIGGGLGLASGLMSDEPGAWWKRTLLGAGLGAVGGKGYEMFRDGGQQAPQTPAGDDIREVASQGTGRTLPPAAMSGALTGGEGGGSMLESENPLLGGWGGMADENPGEYSGASELDRQRNMSARESEFYRNLNNTEFQDGKEGGARPLTQGGLAEWLQPAAHRAAGFLRGGWAPHLNKGAAYTPPVPTPDPIPVPQPKREFWAPSKAAPEPDGLPTGDWTGVTTPTLGKGDAEANTAANLAGNKGTAELNKIKGIGAGNIWAAKTQGGKEDVAQAQNQAAKNVSLAEEGLKETALPRPTPPGMFLNNGSWERVPGAAPVVPQKGWSNYHPAQVPRKIDQVRDADIQAIAEQAIRNPKPAPVAPTPTLLPDGTIKMPTPPVKQPVLPPVEGSGSDVASKIMGPPAPVKPPVAKAPSTAPAPAKATGSGVAGKIMSPSAKPSSPVLPPVEGSGSDMPAETAKPAAPAKSPATKPSTAGGDFEAKFLRETGTRFDPKSVMDRENMRRLKAGEPTLDAKQYRALKGKKASTLGAIFGALAL